MSAVAAEPAARAPALELRSVVSGYGNTTVLRDVSLTVPAGSVTALLGPNGAGKTTLLKTVSGLLRPTAGSVSMDGREVTKLSPFRRTGLGLCHIPEGRGVFRGLTVRENLVMQSKPGTEEAAIERATEAFPIVGKRLGQLAGTLSGGEQQMLAMARAYVQDPRLILVDEASLGLAPLVVDSIFTFLHRLAESGAALLIVDQFVSRALEMATTAYVLRRGEIVFDGSAVDLRERDVFNDYLGRSDPGH
ncbi:MAG: branched-chain amino acid transporter ATPase [Aeromicrobium sp.]|nr:branched-chain amino acid transporter ATPase [Aeromicrobium sp.]